MSILGDLPVIGGLFGGGSSSGGFTPLAPPQQYTPNMGRLNEAQDLLFNKATTDPKNISKSGQLQLDLLKNRFVGDQGQLRAANQGATDTGISNATLFGADRGSINRMTNAGARAGANAMQGLFSNNSNQQLMTQASDFARQDSERNQALQNIMGTASSAIAPVNEANMFNTQQNNQYTLANAQGQALQGQADAQKRKAGIGALGAVAGGLFGATAGGGLGAKLGASGGMAFGNALGGLFG